MKELPINPPDPEDFPNCPECGEELCSLDRVYFDRAGNYLGCDYCIESKFADEYFTD